MKELIIKSVEEMNNLAATLASKAFPGMVLCLSGDLGAGKTTFSKAFGKALGIKAVINSPTYTIMKIYDDGKLPFYHYDFYRLEGDSFDYDLEEYLYLDGVSIVEWPEKFLDILPSERLEMSINVIDEVTRKVTLKTNSKKYGEIYGINN